MGILNSDNFYPSDDVLLTVAAAFAADPLLDAVYGDLNYVGEFDTGKIIRKWHAKPYNHDR